MDIVERMENYIPGEPTHEEAVPEVMELAIAEIHDLRRRIEKLESEVRVLKQYEMKDNRRR